MDASDVDRLKRLLWSMPFVFLPIVLFYPVFARLTICPPSWGEPVAKAFTVGFILSEAWAIRKLTRAINWQFDGEFDSVTAGAAGLLVISAAVAGLLLWLLLRTPPA